MRTSPDCLHGLLHHWVGGAALHVLCALVIACSDVSHRPAPPLNANPVSDAGAANTAPDAGLARQWAPDPLATHCGPVPASISPQSINEVVEALNQFEKPVTLGCFLRSLARPLRMLASTSLISAQPAFGKRSPRMFTFEGPLVMTVVPMGDGSALLEMGEFVSAVRSIKAELHFPIKEPLLPSAPFADIASPEGTSCRGCHAAEEASESVPGAFISDALKPASHEHVPLAFLMAEAEACDVYAEAGRCAILHGLFAYGPVEQQEFPEEVRIFQ